MDLHGELAKFYYNVPKPHEEHCEVHDGHHPLLSCTHIQDIPAEQRKKTCEMNSVTITKKII
uniref:Uncharacterized protein n=1 Tax=Rhizophora mucronata TaxID=61149 RepID=A0A2P2PF18_RHIMU